MRRSISLFLVAAACGGHPTTTTKPTGNTAGSGTQTVASTTTKSSCETAAKALQKERGFGSIPAKSQEAARKGGEAEAYAACVNDQWEQNVIDCAVTRPSPASCLGQLNVMQEASYQGRFAGWEQKWASGAMTGDMGGQGYGGMGDPNGVEGGVVGGEVGGYPGGYTPPPEEEYVACNVDNAKDYAPVVKDGVADHDYLVAMRKTAIQQTCEMKWPVATKKCFNAAKDAAAVATCRGKLDDPQKNALENSLVEVDARIKKLADLEKTPKAIECKAVAAAHYSDDAWRGKMMSLSASERKRVMSESTTVMTKACTDDKWPAVERACIVSATHRDYDMIECVIDEQSRMSSKMYKFGFPAGGVTFKTGIADCDKIVEVAQKLAKCDKLDKSIRDSLVDSLGSTLAMYVDGGYGQSKTDIAASCRQTVDMYIQGGKARGCEM